MNGRVDLSASQPALTLAFAPAAPAISPITSIAAAAFSPGGMQSESDINFLLKSMKACQIDLASNRKELKKVYKKLAETEGKLIRTSGNRDRLQADKLKLQPQLESLEHTGETLARAWSELNTRIETLDQSANSLSRDQMQKLTKIRGKVEKIFAKKAKLKRWEPKGKSPATISSAQMAAIAAGSLNLGSPPSPLIGWSIGEAVDSFPYKTYITALRGEGIISMNQLAMEHRMTPLKESDDMSPMVPHQFKLDAPRSAGLFLNGQRKTDRDHFYQDLVELVGNLNAFRIANLLTQGTIADVSKNTVNRLYGRTGWGYSQLSGIAYAVDKSSGGDIQIVLKMSYKASPRVNTDESISNPGCLLLKRIITIPAQDMLEKDAGYPYPSMTIQDRLSDFMLADEASRYLSGF